MRPKWKHQEAGPNVNTNYHTTREPTFRDVSICSTLVSKPKLSTLTKFLSAGNLWRRLTLRQNLHCNWNLWQNHGVVQGFEVVAGLQAPGMERCKKAKFMVRGWYNSCPILLWTLKRKRKAYNLEPTCTQYHQRLGRHQHGVGYSQCFMPKWSKEHLVTSSPTRRPMALELQRGQCLGLALQRPVGSLDRIHHGFVVRQVWCWSWNLCHLELQQHIWYFSSLELKLLSNNCTLVFATDVTCFFSSKKFFVCLLGYSGFTHHDPRIHHGTFESLRIHNQVPPTLTNITESLKLEGIGILDKSSIRDPPASTCGGYPPWN